ncbi:MAG: hypothetical protein ABR576_15310 [Thermoanaerobaculia bacterium]
MSVIARIHLRRTAAAASAVPLLFVLLAANRPGELERRLAHLAHYAPRPLEVRRLGGSSTAFDRRFYFFLESARRKLPEDVAGVAVFGPESEQARNLVAYQFAPLPAVVRPRPIPAGWIAAVYGPVRPPGWRHVADVSDGALMWPAP